MKVPDKPLRRLCIVATVPMSLNAFMVSHVKALSEMWDITLLADGQARDVEGMLSSHVRFFPVKIIRKISPFYDLRTLYGLWKLFRRERFEAVHSLMPKSGLLAMLAARFSGIPLRIHIFTGQVWATRRGINRCFLKAVDRLLASCATHLLADSHSQCEFLLAEGIANAQKINVLAHGSVCGVDTARFTPDLVRRKVVRNKHSLSEDAVVILYLGRLTSDKGVKELAKAFARAAVQEKDMHLLVVGPDEEGLRQQMIGLAGEAAKRIHFVDYSPEPEMYFAAADFFVLPSYREGFGSTVLEAAACGIPSIGSRIYGLTDAIVEGETGLLVPVGDVDALAEAIAKLATDRFLRLAMGKRALDRALKDFQPKLLTDALISYYEKAWSSLSH